MKKLTKEYIESLVVSTKYFYTDKVTICVLTPKNGFEITAYSGTIDPENFDKEIGEKIAYNNAINILWGHEGYLATENNYMESISKAETRKQITVAVPENTTNIQVSLDNHLVGEVNEGLEVRYIRYPLPGGGWKITNIHGNSVSLKRVSNERI
jgi:hypothetical protein